LTQVQAAIKQSLIEQVQNASDGMTSGHVMVDVGIKVMSQYNMLARMSQNILSKEYLQ
jgi:hypothetical protein